MISKVESSYQLIIHFISYLTSINFHFFLFISQLQAENQCLGFVGVDDLRFNMERYEVVKEIGSGNFGVAKLVRDKVTKELFAVKFIERGQKVFSSFSF